MKIAILGTRGIPNHYGGFEQFAEYLSQGLLLQGHEIFVYNSHSHPYQEKIWKGINIIHKYDPEKKIGTAGQFIYDLNCILDSRQRAFDIILQLGYTSSSIWAKFLPSNAVIVTNMDGLEWRRTKYNKSVQKLIHFFEKLAVSSSDTLIADSIGIQNYIKERYGVSSIYIPYGAECFSDPAKNVLKEYDLTAYQYDLIIARLEPENSIEVILDGIVQSKVNRPLLIIGNYKTKYGSHLRLRYKSFKNKIVFFGPLYNIEKLNNLRHFSNLYFHGHTVGGTNPSLLEAMASSALICAHKNTFNHSILGEDAFYFEDSEDVQQIYSLILKEDEHHLNMIERNLAKITSYYTWEKIISQYLDVFEGVTQSHKN